jgi:hypothetical protein
MWGNDDIVTYLKNWWKKEFHMNGTISVPSTIVPARYTTVNYTKSWHSRDIFCGRCGTMNKCTTKKHLGWLGK